jgi:dephospho-CoA kinase
MIRIAITGNIGSGKSTISQLFENNGIPVFNTDKCSREAEEESSIQLGFKRIIDEDIFIDGKLDRDRLRSIIFTNKDKLREITNLITPYIKKSFEDFCEKHNDKGIVMLESAILFENSHEKNFDYIITVTATENTRIRRVINRDKVTLETVMNKLANQLPELEKVSKSNFVVVNDGYDLIDSLELLTKQVEAIVKAIKYDLLMKKADDLGEALNDYKKTNE